MREIRSSGSVEGVINDGHSYSDWLAAQWAPRARRLRIQNMSFVLAAGILGARCTVQECRAADLAGQQLRMQQRETHTA